MSDIIHLLPDHIANQIAAGEVIQRPASVVKELMENAIDAGAKNIAVNIKDAGRTLVQVIDDGKGMTETDARMAFERHATSKISSVEDLFSLHTMGFRGEALASIAAVAQVELQTCTADSDIGVRVSISGSTPEAVMPEACRAGSIFSVKNLFYNVPARRKFLKTNDTEFRHILTEFERVALVHPHIAFTLRNQDAMVFDLPVGGLRQRIVDIFGKNMNQKLLPVEADTSLVKIKGFTARIDSVKKGGHLQYFFVNGRYMRHPYFHRAVMYAYERMIPAGEMPDYFIFFEIDPSTIDVNIHPTKTEIKFENERPVWQIVSTSVRETLAKSNSVPSIDFESAGIVDIPVYNPSPEETAKVRPPEIEVNRNYNPFREMGTRRPTSDWSILYESFENDRSDALLPPEAETPPFTDLPPDCNTASPVVTPEKNAECRLFANVSNPCFQYRNRYVITPLKSGLVIIDQHRAHTRILYERYINNLNHRQAVTQKLLFPEIIEFTMAESSLLPSLTEEIKYLGFDLAHMGGNSYAIHGVPADAASAGGNPVALVKELVAAAVDNRGGETEKRTEKMALSLARATAIPSGKTMTSVEMETLTASLFAIEANGMTPDGHPVLTILTDEELSKRF
jgi:DNA mismatch repair protein MutL